MLVEERVMKERTKDGKMEVSKKQEGKLTRKDLTATEAAHQSLRVCSSE